MPAGLAGLLDGGGPLSEFESARVAGAFGIEVARSQLVSTADEAAAAARRIGYPVVVKASGRSVQHKTEAGLVRVGVPDEDGVRRSFEELAAAPGSDGVLVQERVGGGEEVIVGFSEDPQFGPVVLFGLGGVFVEVLNDVALRVAPLTRHDAETMIRQVRAFPLLDGARGRPKADVDALTDLILRVSAMAMDLRERVRELDLNPVRVLPEGKGAVALDALLVRK